MLILCLSYSITAALFFSIFKKKKKKSKKLKNPPTLFSGTYLVSKNCSIDRLLKFPAEDPDFTINIPGGFSDLN